MSDERFAVDGWDTAKMTPVGNEQFDTWADVDASGNVLTRRLFGAGFDDVVARLQGGVVSWYGTDRQGSVRTIFDNSGGVVASSDFDAWGNVTAGALTDRYGFTGLDWDGFTRLWMPANGRPYDADIGRWLAGDERGFDAGDVNLSRYVGNGPTNGVDPSGEMIFVWDYDPAKKSSPSLERLLSQLRDDFGQAGIKATPTANILQKDARIAMLDFDAQTLTAITELLNWAGPERTTFGSLLDRAGSQTDHMAIQLINGQLKADYYRASDSEMTALNNLAKARGEQALARETARGMALDVFKAPVQGQAEFGKSVADLAVGGPRNIAANIASQYGVEIKPHQMWSGLGQRFQAAAEEGNLDEVVWTEGIPAAVTLGTSEIIPAIKEGKRTGDWSGARSVASSTTVNTAFMAAPRPTEGLASPGTQRFAGRVWEGAKRLHANEEGSVAPLKYLAWGSPEAAVEFPGGFATQTPIASGPAVTIVGPVAQVPAFTTATATPRYVPPFPLPVLRPPISLGPVQTIAPGSGSRPSLYGDPSIPGRIDYGTIDPVTGNRSGTRARITLDMILGGTEADRAIRPPGFISGLPPHRQARGHLHGNQLGGSGDMTENLVTVWQNPVNVPRMTNVERQVRIAVESGEIVYYYSTPLYQNGPGMPSHIRLRARGSGGLRLDVTIENSR